VTKPDPFALYPFLAGADRPSIASLLESVRLSMLDKAEDVCRLREEMASEHDGDVEAAGRAIAAESSWHLATAEAPLMQRISRQTACLDRRGFLRLH
jgi:hypothetical protein